MDTSWITQPRISQAYIDGVIEFIKLAKENLIEGKTRCPCNKCKVNKWFSIEEVEYHILFKGFWPKYKKWIFHGKEDIVQKLRHKSQTSTNNNEGRGELKKRGLNSTNDHVEVQNMKMELASVKKLLRTLTRQLMPIYDVVCSGQASNEIIEEGPALLTAAADMDRDELRSSDHEPNNFSTSPSTPSSPN